MDSINTLPNEILINIFGYVIPKCTQGKLSHNGQKMILGSVSKRFNELTKKGIKTAGIKTCDTERLRV